MKFTKLASGNWNARVYDYTDGNGKKHTKSFTASTKAEIKMMVAEWKSSKDAQSRCVLRLSEAFQGYFDLKENVLSPATIRAYKGIKKNHIDGTSFGRMQVNKIKPINVQQWVSDLSATHSAKTVRNAYGLLTAVLAVYAPEMTFKATLPAKTKPSLYCPNEADVAAVLKAAAAIDSRLVLAIMLAAFIPARRGEVCALEYSDINGNVVTINKSLVKSDSAGWIVKQPKTFGSYRSVEINQEVIDMIPKGKGRIIDWTPDYLTLQFEKCVTLAGVPKFRFHDLRHFGASMLATRMSSRYLQDRGGWQSANVMNSVYNNVIDMEKTRQTKDALQVFDNLIKKID